MPDRDRNTVTQRVTLGDGQINLNGTVLDVNGITFTQDGIEAAAFNNEPIVRLDNDAEITATATIANYDEYEEAMRRLMNNTRAATTATTYNPYFTAEDLRRMVDRITETPLTNVATTQDIRIGVDRAQHQDGYVAQTYMFDNPWVAYNPYLRTDEFVNIHLPDEECEEPELDGDNAQLDGFLGEFVKEAV